MHLKPRYEQEPISYQLALIEQIIQNSLNILDLSRIIKITERNFRRMCTVLDCIAETRNKGLVVSGTIWEHGEWAY